jgi:proteic killer suppression protein
VIRSFADRTTEQVWEGTVVRHLPSEVQRIGRRKLRMLNAAQTLADLRNPPGNRLEALQGDRLGQSSLRINVQWRICFVWRDGDAHDVEIVDYH